MAGNYASFALVTESGSSTQVEAKQKALEVLRKKMDRITEDNVKVIPSADLETDRSRTLKVGDRVAVVVDNKQEVGTIVSFFLMGRNGPLVFVRLDNGALRSIPLRNLRLLD